ncbi:SufS family cysteine desulfurase [Candidatus Berkelbacteria bacterium]|nr:SufS family cysteine desulfurase [Candidatus Berkelbacteria bacterium]
MRDDFPYLKRRVHGHPVVYFDNAATTQKPNQVIEAITAAAQATGNVHRGIHTFSHQTTEQFEAARQAVADFFGADARQIIFTKNATEALNIVVWGFGAAYLKRGDTVLLTEMEHHSNLVPWLMLGKRQNIRIAYVRITSDGRIDQKDLVEKLDRYKPKIVALTHASNVLGTINPLQKIVATVKAKLPDTLVVADGAQAAPHIPVDVAALGVDFYAISGHKMLGPTGIGALYGRSARLEQLQPVFGGGDMIRSVSFSDVAFADLPWRFEAGTPPVFEAIALAAAIRYLTQQTFAHIVAHEQRLIEHFLKKFDAACRRYPFVLYGPQSSIDRTATFSFNVEGIHAHDLASLLDGYGIAIRSGHHCAQPLMERLGIKAAARVSLYVYNTKDEIDYFFKVLEKICEDFGRING